jgi:hypothetical protein
MADELDYLLNASEGGVESYGEDIAAISRISEWLDTPQGQVWGSPSWGHTLTQYKHQPMSGDTAAAIENSIAAKLPIDLPDIAISYIRVEPKEIDFWHIAIGIMSISQSLSKEVAL